MAHPLRDTALQNIIHSLQVKNGMLREAKKFIPGHTVVGGRGELQHLSLYARSHHVASPERCFKLGTLRGPNK